jgi:serine/threonine protein phosphatase PrpC
VQIVLGTEDKFVILACDGLWDVLTSQAVVDFVSSRLGEFQQQRSLDQIAEELALHAIDVRPSYLTLCLALPLHHFSVRRAHLQ